MAKSDARAAEKKRLKAERDKLKKEKRYKETGEGDCKTGSKVK